MFFTGGCLHSSKTLFLFYSLPWWRGVEKGGGEWRSTGKPAGTRTVGSFGDKQHWADTRLSQYSVKLHYHRVLQE